MIGGNISYKFGTWNGNNSYSRLEALALNMLNIATTTSSTESYNDDEIWYDKNDKSKQTYTYYYLIQVIIDRADINNCIKIKNAAIVLLSAVNDRFKQDAIHESRRGTLDSGHTNYTIKLSKMYNELDSALSSRVHTLIAANMLQNKLKKINPRIDRMEDVSPKKSRSHHSSPKKQKADGTGKKQRTRTKPKSKKKSRNK